MYIAILQLSVIIVNYNVRHFLEQCLFSVQHAIVGMDAEVFVVDNASQDAGVGELTAVFPWVQFIINSSNLGFGRANNQALEKCRGEYILLLNPDTLVPEDCFRKTLSFMAVHPDAGALGVKMLDGRGRFLQESKRAFPSPWVSFCKMTGLAWLFPNSRFFNRYALGHLNENEDHEVEILAGAFMLVRKQIMHELGGFDERFFLYGEDIDLCYRIRVAGWKNWYFTGSPIIHFKGESSSGAALIRVKHFYRAMLVFVRKHYQGGSATLFSFFLKTAIALRATLSALKQLIRGIIAQKKKNNMRVLVIGTEKEYADLQLVTGELSFVYRISPDKVTKNRKASAAETAVLFKKHKADSLIFCVGELSMTEAIVQAQLLRDRRIHFLFHMAGSHYIVGSHAVICLPHSGSLRITE